LLQAEARAEFAEKTVKKLQKEVDRLEGTCFAVIVANTLLNFEVNLVHYLVGRRKDSDNGLSRVGLLRFWIVSIALFYKKFRFINIKVVGVYLQNCCGRKMTGRVSPYI
jgi:hypothetical protein